MAGALQGSDHGGGDIAGRTGEKDRGHAGTIAPRSGLRNGHRYRFSDGEETVAAVLTTSDLERSPSCFETGENLLAVPGELANQLHFVGR
jgi:hypothetical protein